MSITLFQQHVRCMYDYDPRSDDLIPCQQAGMKFECGDILEIVSKTDRHWWQVRYFQTVRFVVNVKIQNIDVLNVQFSISHIFCIRNTHIEDMQK